MKKIFSILAVLVLLIAFYPSKVEAKVLPVDAHKATTVSTEHYKVYVCDGAGSDCPIEGVLIQ